VATPLDSATQRGVSTFVADVHAELEAALRTLLDLPAHLPIEWTTVGEDSLRKVAVRVPAAGLGIELLPRGSEPSPTLPGRHLDLRLYPLHSTPTPEVLRPLLRRFRRHEPHAGEHLVGLARRSFRLRDLGDHAFRDLSAGDSGLRAVLRLGFRCNQDCDFCWQARDWPEPPPERWVRWLDELLAAGATHVAFSGGEPTLHPDLPDLIRRARDADATVSVQTNAIRLASPKYRTRLREAGLDRLFVSLHAGEPTLSDELTGAPGTFGPTLRGIDAALAAGMSVDLNAVVERRNHDRLEEHARLIVDRFTARDTPVRAVQYSQPSRYRREALRPLGLVRMSDARPHLVAAARLLLDAGVVVVVAGTCGFPPCLFIDTPELVQAIDPGRFEGMDVSSREYAEPCRDCAMKARCLGVRREYLDAFGADGLRPFDRAPDRVHPEARPALRPPRQDRSG